MTDDENPIGIDLEAWAPPVPPRAMADGVIARMQESRRAAELQTMPQGNRRWWVAGGVAAAVAVSAVLGAWGIQRTPANGSGTVVAERPRHLELGSTTAELDASAEVRWRRDGHRVTIEQLRGAATWRIDDLDTVMIDAGAMGASVEATGASLRVEVSMKQPEIRSDEGVEERARSARMLGASALTAAAVALVTVVVYEGRVKVTRGGQTIALAPGTSYEVRPADGPREQLAVGAGPVQVSDLEERVRILEAQLAEQRTGTDKPVADKPAGTDRVRGPKQVDPFARSRGNGAVDPPDRSDDDIVDPFGSRTGTRVDPFSSPRTPKVDTSCDEVSCVLDNYAGSCCGAFKARKSAGWSFDRTTISAAMTTVKTSIATCGRGFEGTVKARVKVAASGRVDSVTIEPSDAAPAACVKRVLGAMTFTSTTHGGSFTYPFVFGICDADALAVQGWDLYSNASYAQALVKYEQAISCRPSAGLELRAFMAACNSKNVRKAAAHYAKLAPNTQQTVLSVCVRNGIGADQLAAAPRGTAANTGKLNVASTPAARIAVDGIDVGESPVELDLAPGKHKVTFTINGDRHTFAVTVEGGKTVTLSKQL